MGHFGARPIRLTWTAFVLPSLVLNYFGQGALTLAHPKAIENPFFLLGPDWLRLPMVILATVATVPSPAPSSAPPFWRWWYSVASSAGRAPPQSRCSAPSS
jgi:hypothetical protein